MQSTPLRYLRADFDELEEYTPVKPLDVLAAEIGVPIERLVKLDANENLYGPLPEIREAIERADLHIYPDPGQTALREAIAGYAGVTPEQVVAGTGADELIDIVLRLTMPEAVVNVTPTFGMYQFLAQLSRARVVDVPRRTGFAPDLEGIAKAVGDGARVVFLPRADMQRMSWCFDGVDRVLQEGEALPPLDFHVSLMSLATRFGTTLPTIPADVPYLRARPGDAERWERRLASVRRPLPALLYPADSDGDVS